MPKGFGLTKEAPGYPQALYAMKNPPSTLYVLGNANLLQSDKLVAMIGSQYDVTDESQAAGSYAANVLAQYGYVIVNSLAPGCEEAAVDGALLGGKPVLLILPNPIPEALTEKQTKILANGGCIVSLHASRRGNLEDASALQSFLTQRVLLIQGQAVYVVNSTLETAIALNHPRACFSIQEDHTDKFTGNAAWIAQGATTFVHGADNINEALLIWASSVAQPKTAVERPINYYFRQDHQALVPTPGSGPGSYRLT